MSAEIKQHLLEGKVVQIKGTKQLAILVPFADEQALAQWKSIDNQQPLVLLTRTEQVYDVIQKVPELLWDIIEFTENYLAVLLDQPKYLSKPLLNELNEIKITLLLRGDLHKLLNGYRKPVVAFFFDLNSPLPTVDNVLHLEAKEVWPSSAKTMRLALNGEIKFL